MTASSPRHRPILVTGSLGQLGSELCRQIGPTVVGVDLPEFDLTDAECVNQTLDRLLPRVVINTAAYTQVDRAETEPEIVWAVNVEGVARLARACQRHDALLVQLSTDYVFGADSTRTTPYAEDDPPGPLSVYGQSKVDAERVAGQTPEHLIVRSCGLYGPLGPRTLGNFVATMLRLGRQGKTLRVVDDQHCTPSFVGDVARAIRFLIDGGQRGTFHVVNHGSTTWHDFAVEIFRVANLNVSIEPIPTVEYPLPASRPTYSVLSTAKYDALPSAPPLPSWQTALATRLESRL